MKKMITHFKLLTLLIAALFVSSSVSAVNFTAVASGNFSSNATWSGGIAPGTTISGDNIIIPTGITVNLDQNLELKSSASLSVVGALKATGAQYLTIDKSTMAGTGSITVDSFTTNFASGYTYTGTISTRVFKSYNAMLSVASNISVSEALYLSGGVLTLNAGSFTMTGSQNMIVVEGGTISLGSATLTLTNNYSVLYRSQSATTGVELNGSGLEDVMIDVGVGNDVTLSSDLMVKGKLNLMAGTLVLNNNNLTFGTNSSFDASADGLISSTSGSDITIMSGSSLNGRLTFDSGNTVDDLTINFGSIGAKVMLGSDLMVSGVLDLQAGKIDVVSHKLYIMNSASVNGGSANSYVVTGIGGSLSMDIAASGSATYHVGTDNNYAPCIINSNGDSYIDMKASVNADVMSNGTFGYNLNDTEPMVNTTWFVENSASANVDIDMEVWWSMATEVNAFDRTKAYISHYTNGSWDMDASANAMMQTNGMYSIKRSGIKSLSPFAVFDESTTTSVNNIAANDRVNIYPNPTVNELYITNAENATAEVYNTSGQLIQTTVIADNNHKINISALSDGIYYMRVHGEGLNSTQKFIKQ